LLAVVFRQLVTTQKDLDNLFNHFDRAIMILEAMDDCLVARNAIVIIKRTVARAKRVSQPALSAQSSTRSHDDDLDGTLGPLANVERQIETGNSDTILLSTTTTGNGLSETVSDMDWFGTYPSDDSQQALFWTKWVHELDSLGI
jgi:hypothetical protein